MSAEEESLLSLDELLEKYKSSFDEDGNLVLPKSLQWKHLELEAHESYYTFKLARRHINLEKLCNPEKYQQYKELRRLIELRRPNHALLLKLLDNSQYINIPKACKFPGEMFVNGTCNFYYDGRDFNLPVFKLQNFKNLG